MQVPRSAIGKTGLCPNCGRTVPITGDNTTNENRAKGGGRAAFDSGGSFAAPSGVSGGPSDDAKRRFGQAVDLYYNHRHAEALAIFNGLAKDFPGNADIETGRALCLEALRSASNRLALEDKHGGAGGDGLSVSLVRQVVLEKLLYGGTDAAQLQAAELALKLLEMGEGGSGAPAGEDVGEEAETPDEAAHGEGETGGEPGAAEESGGGDGVWSEPTVGESGEDEDGAESRQRAPGSFYEL